MPHTTKLWQERKRKGLCVNCGGKPKAGCLRCESCLKRQRDYDKVYRDKQKGAIVEPQCKPSSGPMKPDHEWDDDTGLCIACGKKRTAFAPRPELRPDIVKVRAHSPARVAQALAQPTPKLPPVRQPKPKAETKAPLHSRPHARAPVARPAEEPARIDYRGVIAALELERDEIDVAIETLRRVQAREATAGERA